MNFSATFFIDVDDAGSFVLVDRRDQTSYPLRPNRLWSTTPFFSLNLAKEERTTETVVVKAVTDIIYDYWARPIRS